MNNNNNHNVESKFKLGILAYGSLINEPGDEISELEIDRIDCKTPFCVEFARISRTRSEAPTLIPYNQGKEVNAKIIILNPTTGLNKAKDILWRRETGRKDRTGNYQHSDNPGKDKMVIKSIDSFMGVETILYTSFQRNIDEELTAELLSEYAIKSILTDAGKNEKDGIRYLLNAKKSGINTELTDQYESEILRQSGTNTLEEAIEKFDKQRDSANIINE